MHYFDVADLQRLRRVGEPEAPDDPLVAHDSWSKRADAFRLKTTIGRAVWQRPQPDFEATPDYTAYRETLTRLKTSGAQLCMLRTPITHGYLEAIAKDERYLAAETAFRHIAADIGVRYLDFRDLPMAYPDSVFRDQDHLNRTGSRSFVPLVMQRCFAD